MLTFADAVPKFQAILQTMSIHQSSIHLQIHDAEAYYPAGNPVRFSDYYALANGLKRTRVNLNPHYVRSRSGVIIYRIPYLLLAPIAENRKDKPQREREGGCFSREDKNRRNLQSRPERN